MLSVASCSSNGDYKRKRDSDCETSDAKIPRLQYFVLESESDIASSDEDIDSVWSLQNKSTDYAKDTSDTTSTKVTTDAGSITGVEYEVVSLSEHEAPFSTCTSGPDSNMEKSWAEVQEEKKKKEDSGSLGAADGSSAADETDSNLPDFIHLRQRNCLRCKTLTNCPRFCYNCYKVRKEFFPPRPKWNKKKRGSKRADTKKPCLSNEANEASSDGTVAKTVSNWVDTSSSQELSLPPNSGCDGLGVCNICRVNPINGGFLHKEWVHIYSCYSCSQKVWFNSSNCPLCNCKIKQVVKVAFG